MPQFLMIIDELPAARILKIEVCRMTSAAETRIRRSSFLVEHVAMKNALKSPPHIANECLEKRALCVFLK